MRKRFLHSAGWLIALFLMTISTVMAQSPDSTAVVHAVLFYSPTCPHCHEVIEKVLVPMVEQYGNQLQIMAVDTTQENGSTLYQSAVDYYQISAERRGVPTLIVGDTVLVGSGEIPNQFPGIVETALKDKGIDWPALPGMTKIVEKSMAPQAVAAGSTAQSPVATPTLTASPASPAETAAQASLPATPTKAATQAPLSVPAGPAEIAPAASLEEALKPAEDPLGVAFGWLVMIGLAAALGGAARRILTAGDNLLRLQPAGAWRSWIFPALVAAGLVIAGYLAYVEVNQVEAVCGPVGHCNVVQSSPYARILGIPIAVLGLLNYLVLLGLWGSYRFIPGKWGGAALLALTLAGVCFSIYLTALELLVIQAICMWCLGSAVVTALLMALVWLSPTTTPPGEETPQ